MKQFLDYLFYIGIVSKETINNLLRIIEEKSNKNKEEKIKKNEFIHAILFDFFKSLNTEDLSKLAENIYKRYKLNQNSTFSKYLIKVINVRAKQELRKINSCFKKWKKKCTKKNNATYSNRNLSTDITTKAYNKKKRSNTPQINNDKSLNHPANILPDFFKRLILYDTKKKNDKIKYLMKNEEEYNTNCTFSPNLDLTIKKNNEVKQKIKTKESIKDEETTNKDKAKKILDKERINRLYTDYHTRIINNSNLKKNIDAENGITFSPYVNHESQYYKNVKDNLFERNKILLENKKEFVDGFNYIRNIQMKGVDIGSKNNKK